MSTKRRRYGERIFYTHLRDIYQNQARYVVLFASSHYAQKVWTNHERESAQARAIGKRAGYILPARFDDAVIPGLLSTTGYIDLRQTSPSQLTALVLEKLGRRRGSWEAPEVDSLPGEDPPRENLRERSTRLSKQHRVQQNREEFLSSQRAVDLAQAEIKVLTDYVLNEVRALKQGDPEL